MLEAGKIKNRFTRTKPNKVAAVTWDQVKAIAEDKMVDLNCFTIESAMKMVAGTARSMGITVKGEFPIQTININISTMSRITKNRKSFGENRKGKAYTLDEAARIGKGNYLLPNSMHQLILM